jgi:hypothetical protein
VALSLGMDIGERLLIGDSSVRVKDITKGYIFTLDVDGKEHIVRPRPQQHQRAALGPACAGSPAQHLDPQGLALASSWLPVAPVTARTVGPGTPGEG